jgi:hypothetical protein
MAEQLPDADEPCVVLISAPGVDSAPLRQIFDKVYGDHCFHVPFVGAVDAVRACTLQDARKIKCITMSNPLGFHRYFGAPVPNVPLREDGLFTGRDIVHVALVANPVHRQLTLQQQIASAPDHPYNERAKSCNFHEFLEFMSEAEPGITNNQQCGLLSGESSRTFKSAKMAIMSQPFLASTPENIGPLARALGIRLGWDTNHLSVVAASSPPGTNGISRILTSTKDSFMQLYYRHRQSVNDHDEALFRWIKSAPDSVRRGSELEVGANANGAIDAHDSEAS